jgi:hypothetical protein
VATLDFTDDLAIVIGDDFQYTFEFQDANCDPIDQEANTFEATITRNDVVGELVTISLSEVETAALTPKKSNVKWRLRRTEGDLTTTVVSGDAEIVEL